MPARSIRSEAVDLLDTTGQDDLDEYDAGRPDAELANSVNIR
jgi:hypothetical protein